MNVTDVILDVVLIAGFTLLTSSRVRTNQAWPATVTPLASIIGSGLVIAICGTGLSYRLSSISSFLF